MGGDPAELMAFMAKKPGMIPTTGDPEGRRSRPTSRSNDIDV